MSEQIHLPHLIGRELGISFSEARRLIMQGAVTDQVGEAILRMDVEADGSTLSVGNRRSVILPGREPQEASPTSDGSDPPFTRINKTLRTWMPETEEHGELVHRDHVASAFAAGMRAAVTIEVPDEEIANEFAVWCEEAFSE